MADLIKEFKSKIDKMAKATGWKYKILYKGYEEALKENRLHCFFHKPCKLAEITTPEGVVTFEIAGTFEADLLFEGEYVLTLSDNISPLTPFDTTTVDDTGVSHDGISISNDKDVVKYSDPKGVWRFDFKNTTYVQAVFGDKTHVFDDPSIAKAIFNVDAIKELVAASEEKPEPKEEKPAKEAPEAKEPPEKKETKKAEKKPAKKESPKKEPDFKEFEIGALRGGDDALKPTGGKGRMDLVPADMIAALYACVPDGTEFEEIARFQETHDGDHLVNAAKVFAEHNFDCVETALLEYGCHMEDGCQKYGDRNWEKGIPLHSFVDSGLRHLLKFKRGDDDERHDRAFIWNMLCGAWTCKHHPDLIEQ